jgi:hypothetical protein
MADTKIDWTKLPLDNDWSYNIPKGISDVKSTPVLCKDGTTKNQLSSPNAQYMDACVNNGGIAQNNTNPYEVTCNDGSKDVGNGSKLPCSGHGGVKKTTIVDANAKNKTQKEPIYYILVTAGAIALGYLVYKKFIK